MNGQLEDARRKRADELRGNADNAKLDRLGAEIARLETIAARHQERIGLFEAEAVEADRQRRVRENEALIKRIEKKVGAERRAAAKELADGIAPADKGFRELPPREMCKMLPLMLPRMKKPPFLAACSLPKPLIYLASLV